MNRSSAIVVAAILTAVGATAAFAQEEEIPDEGTGAAVVEAGGDPLGVPYEEWAARYGLWLANLDVAPPTNDCQADQGGDAFFLPYALPAESAATTTCTVPPGTPILVAIAPSFRDISYCPATEETLRACLERDLAGGFADASLTVDGQPVAAIEDYAIVSPLFDVEYGDGGAVAGEPGTAAQAMVSGVFVMLEPLSPGSHDVELHFTLPDEEFGDTPFALSASIEVAEDGTG